MQHKITFSTRCVLFILFAISNLAYAAGSSEFEMGTFDVFAAPKLNLGSGSYKVGSIDDGHFGLLAYGGKMGVKVGPFLLGAEYLEGNTSAQSSKTTVTDTDRYIAQMPDHEKLTSYGVVAGFTVNRVTVWLSHNPYVGMEKNAIVGGTAFKHSYFGTGSGVEINVRVWNLVNVGAYYQANSFSKYSSDRVGGLVDKGSLSSNLETSSYGLTLSYLIPYTAIKKLAK